MISAMKKYILGAVLSLGMLASPAFASAAGLTSSQISAIIGLLQSFGADQSVISNVQTSLNGGTPTIGSAASIPASGVSCISLNNNLYLDVTDTVTDGEVSKLQKFLGGRVTGYFGPATLQLVQNWQATNGIVSSGSPDTTGYGYVGPLTLARLNKLYGCGNNQPPTPTPPVVPQPTPSTQTLGTFIPSTTFVNFNVVQGASNPNPVQITLTNASQASINYTLNVPNQPSWYNVGYATQTLTLNSGGVAGVGVDVDATKVSPGTYTANLIVSGNFRNSPITIPVTLTVTSADQFQDQIPTVDYVQSPPKISYVQSPAGDNNVLYPTESARIFGSNFQAGTNVTVRFFLPGATVYSADVIGVVNGDGTQITFTVPTLSAGSYKLLVYVRTLFETNQINVNVIAPTPPQSSRPSIILTYPQAGYSLLNALAKGDGTPASNPIATIQWTEQNGSYPVNIYLLNQSNQVVRTIAQNAPNTGSYVWAYDSTLPGGTYQIKIELTSIKGDASNTEQIAYSGYFTVAVAPTGIITQPSTPSVTVTYPNGGESLTIGQVTRITWASTNTDKVSLGYSTGPGSLSWIAYNIPNTGYYDWTVNVGNTTNTQFKIQIIAYNTGVGSATDYSDNYFTVR